MDAQATVLEAPSDVIVVVRGSDPTLSDWLSTNARAELLK